MNRLFLIRCFCIAAAPILFLAQLGCESTPPLAHARPGGTNEMDIRVDTTYQPGDKVVIDFADNQGMPPQWQQTIREDGTITLPLNVTVEAAGKRKGELEEDIRNRYVPSLLKRLTVNVRDVQRKYFVRGEVKLPGEKDHPGLITALKAIAAAGDFTDFADRKDIEIIRANTGERIKMNANKASKNPALDVPVYPGDIVNVNRRYF